MLVEKINPSHLALLPHTENLLQCSHDLSIFVEHGGVKDREVLLVVLCLFTELLDGLVVDFKCSRHGAFAGRDKINFGTFVPDDAFLAEVFEQDEHVPRVTHAVETAPKVGSDVVSVPKAHFHLHRDRGHVLVDVFH